ncbi:MAG: carbohydrate binding family 9 domain-containing protein [Saprospiraceae bacterium]|nr:carbohydrate binding family 9 domain-containing protein [Saprospiraceae bacterium]
MYIYLLGFFSHQLKADVNPSRTLKAIRIAEEVKIDGILHEKVWSQSEYASGFIQTEPTPGLPATFETQVYFAYDNNAVYIAARMSDPEPDKILKELSLRDQIGNADNFRIFFDTYRSGLNGFKFFITASGVQLDAVVTNNNDDNNWNAIWQSAVTKDEHGWYAEIKIPYSSLRFPSEAVQDWHVQFGREIRRFRETSYWSPIDPTISGWVQQSGKVTQIENIKSPIRLSLTPYISGYVNTTYDPKSTEKKNNFRQCLQCRP